MMRHKMLGGVVVAGLAVVAAFAQNSSGGIEAPTLGFVYDRASAAILPITGLPGAAMYGTPLLTSIDAASVAPSGDLAIVRNSDGLFAVTSLRDVEPQWNRIGDSGSFLASWGTAFSWGVTWTESGGFSLWSRDTGAAGPGSWTRTPLNLGLPEGTVVGLDYDETRRTLFVSLASAGAGGAEAYSGAYRFSMSDGTLERLIAVKEPGAIAHLGKQVYLVDQGSRTIWAASESSQEGAAARQLLTIENVQGSIVASRDGRRLYIGGATLRVFDRASEEVTELTGQAASELVWLGSVLRISPEHSYLTDAESPQAFWVPAPSGAAAGSR